MRLSLPCSAGKVDHTTGVNAPLTCVAGVRRDRRSGDFEPTNSLFVPFRKPFVDVIAKAALFSQLINDHEWSSVPGSEHAISRSAAGPGLSELR